MSDFYAVIIGFNKFLDQENLPDLLFAEKDAQDLYSVLTDPKYGNYPRDNIVLLTGDVSEDEVEGQLYTHIVRDRTPGDTVLVYYSGHGFIAGDNQKAYLATPNVTIQNILDNPKAGLQMDYLHNEIFMESKAKHVIFLLDCCHSAAFCPTGFKGGDSNLQKKLEESQFFTSEGRVAFVSSPRGVTSRESKDLSNGIFTHYLVKGLQGEAIERFEQKPTGEVTISSLVGYVQHKCPRSQPPVQYGKSTRIVLCRPGRPLVAGDELVQFDENYAGRPIVHENGGLHIPLGNSMERHIEYLERLVQNLDEMDVAMDAEVGNRILNGVRNSLDAEFAFISRFESERKAKSPFNSDFKGDRADIEQHKRQILNDLHPWLIRDKDKFRSERFGFSKPFSNVKDANQNLLAIPLRLDYPREFLIVSGLANTQLQYGEIMGHVLLSLFKATNELTSLDVLKIENYLVDNLRKVFGPVPYNVYKRRFERFKQHLDRIYFAFEPVICLGKQELDIVSWEALARDPDTKAAPVDLFQAAELWGREFVTELDLYCLRNAVTEYKRLWREERADEQIHPLSVNVYPETLFRSAYKRELKSIIRDEDIIKGHNLILEVSEKRPLPDAVLEEILPTGADPIDTFVDVLHSYSRELNIGFAVDDFGVGHSSVSRLAKLELDHVKIDREILHHPHPDCTIAFVLEIVHRSHPHPIRVVLEGFDGESNITLGTLYNLGINYIQGHLIRRASRTVRNLDQDKHAFLLKQLS